MAALFTLALLLASVLVAPSVYGSASIASASRSVFAFDGTNAPQDESSSATSGPYVQSLSSTFDSGTFFNRADASQNTTIGPAGFSGSGATFLDVEPNTPASANSTFDVFFDLAAPHLLSGSLRLDTLIDGGSASALLRLTGPGTDVLLFDPALGNPIDQPLNIPLGPGSYELNVLAVSTASNDDGFSSDLASYQFDLRLQETQIVPEPAVALLLCTAGWLGLVLRGRRPR